MSSEIPADPNRQKAINPHEFRMGGDLPGGKLEEEISVSVFGTEFIDNLEKYKIARRRVLIYLRRKCGNRSKKFKELPRYLTKRLMEKYGVIK